MVAKLSEQFKGYWHKLTQGRSPNSPPEVIEVDAVPIAEDQKLSRWQTLKQTLGDRFRQTPTSDHGLGHGANEVEAQVEDVLEQTDKPKIARVFHRIVQKVKPEDFEQIKTRLHAMQRGPLKTVWEKVQSLAQMANDPEIPWKSKAVAIAALVYLVSPLDAVPDVIPLAGLADDVAVIAAVVSTLAVELEKYMTRQAEKQAAIEIKKRTEIVRITLLGSIAAAAIAIIVELTLKALS